VESEAELRERIRRYAESHGFILNPKAERLDLVIKGLHTNTVKHGAEYCPCRIRTGDVEEDKKIICPCIYHKDEIEKEGSCHCKLLYAA
jgi:ferredoxin-thioredoxin reductase catalytic subunit